MSHNPSRRDGCRRGGDGRGKRSRTIRTCVTTTPEQARERGQVPRSPELSTFAVLMSAGAGLLLLGGALMDALFNIVRAGLTLDRSSAFDTSQLGVRLFEPAAAALLGLAPWFLLVAAAAIVASMMVSGWLFTFEALQPNFSRLSPLRGLGRIFWHGLIELGKAVLKSLLVGGVAAWAIWSDALPSWRWSVNRCKAGSHIWPSCWGIPFCWWPVRCCWWWSSTPFRLWEHARQLRMTKEEVRQEMKETEGDPQIKARIRSLQREAARRRMMAEVPQADVVVTNPDHYAVALRYSEGRSGAPRVVAKGSMLVAQRIIELAEAARVPILRAPAGACAVRACRPGARDSRRTVQRGGRSAGMGLSAAPVP